MGHQKSAPHERFLLNLGEVFNSSYHLTCVAVLVVIPRDNLDLIQIINQVPDHSLSGVKQRAVANADNVG